MTLTTGILIITTTTSQRSLSFEPAPSPEMAVTFERKSRLWSVSWLTDPEDVPQAAISFVPSACLMAS
jgi:hypothetical protein